MTAYEETLHYGWRMLPADGDAYQNQDDLRIPMQQMDQDMFDLSLNIDSGWDDTTVLVESAGWTAVATELSKARTMRDICQVVIAFKRTGAPIVANAVTGAITESLICTMNSNYRPWVIIPTAAYYGNGIGGFMTLEGQGYVKMTHCAPGLNINTNDMVRGSFMFMLP